MQALSLLILISPLLVTCLPTEHRAVCPPTESCGSNDYGRLKAYPQNCTMYIYCDKVGPGILSRCPTNWHYNSVTKHCSTKETAKCVDCTVATTTTKAPTTTTVTTTRPPTTTVTTTRPPTTTVTTTRPPTTTVTTTRPPTTTLTTTRAPTTTVTTTRPPTTTVTTTRPPTTTVTTTRPPTTTVTTTRPPTTTRPTTVTTTNVPTTPSCPATPECKYSDVYRSLPYPPDCRRYIYCSIYGELVLKCLLGYEFSPVTNSCMIANEAKCPYCVPSTSTSTPATTTLTPSTTTRTTTIAPSTTTRTTTIASTTTTIATTTIPACPQTPKCLSVSEHGARKPYPPDCKRYIYCTADPNLPEIRICRSWEEFSPTELKCVNATLAKCPYCNSGVTTTKPPNTTPVTTTRPPTTTVTTTRPTTTVTTTRPTTTVTTTRPTTTVTTTRPTTTVTTTRPTTTTTTRPPTTTLLPLCPATPTCSKAEAGQVKAYPPDCTQYLYCSNAGEAIKSRCPLTRPHFSTTLNRCTSVTEAKCKYCIH